MFGLILGIETLAKSGVVLDFSKKVITIDRAKNTMRPTTALREERMINQFAYHECPVLKDLFHELIVLTIRLTCIDKVSVDVRGIF